MAPAVNPVVELNVPAVPLTNSILYFSILEPNWAFISSTVSLPFTNTLTFSLIVNVCVASVTVKVPFLCVPIV